MELDLEEVEEIHIKPEAGNRVLLAKDKSKK
jgi:hypothetical protein